MLRKLNRFLFLTLVLGLGLLTPSALAAEPVNNVTVTPFLQTIQILPGEIQKQFSLQVTNNAKVTQTFGLSVVNFGTLDETGGVVFEGGKDSLLVKKYGLADWLKLSNNQLTLQSGETTAISGYIDNQSSLKPGGHYGAVIVSALAPQSGGETPVGINQKVSSLIFATKLGGEKYDLSLESISSNKTFTKIPTQVTLRFKNTGNVQIVPRGVVSVVLDGKVISRGIINEQSGMVLPETYRLYDVPLRSLEKPSFIGYTQYQIKVDYRYDGFDQFANKTQNQSLFSILFMIGGALVTLGVIIAITYTFKRSRQAKKPTVKTSTKSSKKP